jgi:hypothetical protein
VPRAHRDGIDYGLYDFFGKRGHHVGLDRTRQHAVDGNALGGGLQGESLGKAEESGFGGGAIGLADSAGLADERADVDYASGSSVEKMAEDCLGHEERSGQIYPED